ncbi:MAG: hypothetical protein RR671_00150 [Raoultibacter sp.]
MPDYKLDQARQTTPTTTELQAQSTAPRSLIVNIAFIVVGIIVALVGIPLLILPGPGIALIVGGLLLAGNGVKSIASNARSNGR